MRILLFFVGFYDIICLDGFTIYQDSYNFRTFTWNDANDFCLRYHNNNTLASIKNDNEMNLLASKLNTYTQ